MSDGNLPRTTAEWVPPEDAVLKTPIPFGKYYLLDRINVGGMAEVFQAKAFGLEGFERIVAVKRILSSIAEDKEFISMFVDEAKIAVQLNHANICQVFDLGKVDESYFIALEYVSGKDVRALYDRCKQRLIDGSSTMPIAQSVFIVMKVCEGLDYAHNKKDSLGNELHLVHRDVSPQNIIVSYEGEVKLIDFGIAKAASNSTVTKSGILKGKFGYMSPEQVRGDVLDRRSDIFSVGIVLYELLTGERLFVGETDFATLEKVRNVEIVPPTAYNRKLPEELERIVLKALSREPEDRYQNAIDLHDDLQAFMYTSGEFYARKDLAVWIKRVFRSEMEAERQALDAARDFRPEVLPPTEKQRARGTMALRALSAELEGRAEPRGELGVNLKAESKGEGKPSSWTPNQTASAPSAATPPQPKPTAESGAVISSAPPPEKGKKSPKPKLDKDDEDSEEMTTVDGMHASGKVADFHWDEDELETHIYKNADGSEGPPQDASSHVVEEREEDAPTLAEAALAEARDQALARMQAEAQRLETEQKQSVQVVPAQLPQIGRTEGRAEIRVDPRPEPRPEPRAEVRTALTESPRTPEAPTEMLERKASPRGSIEDRHEFNPGTTDAAIRTGARPGFSEGKRGSLYAVIGIAASVILGSISYVVYSSRSGELILIAEPKDGVQLTVDGKSIVTTETPPRLKLKPGVYQVALSKEGYLPWSEPIQVKPGETTIRNARMEAVAQKTGGLTIFSDPPGAKGFLDGQELGQVTPMRVQSILPGVHQLELRLGEQSWKEQVVVESGKLKDVRAMLSALIAQKPPEGKQPERPPEKPEKPPERHAESQTEKRPEKTPEKLPDKVASPGPKEPGRDPRREIGTQIPRGESGFLRINSKPWTKITLDGRDTGLNTPQTALKVSPGQHQIVLTNPQFNIRETFTVNVQPGQTLTVVKNLLNQD